LEKKVDKMQIEIYSDGSATTAEKPGGYGWVMVQDGTKISEGSGHMPNASNNDAEMEAAIQGIAAALKHVNALDEQRELSDRGFVGVTLVSDSQLILGWTSGRYRFKQLDKMDKYKQLQFLVKRLNVQTRWVRGHSGDVHRDLPNDYR
jgi:ribonuclease HI